MKIVGISAFYHDSAAALVDDGEIVAAAQEERFSRKKHDPGFPRRAIEYCLDAGGVSLEDLDYVVFYDKPWLKFERLLESYIGFAPKGLGSFLAAMPPWLTEKLNIRGLLKRELRRLSESGHPRMPPLLFTEHHQSHAASAFFASPYQRAAVLCLDGVGEWATTSLWLGDRNQLAPQWQIDFPHSLGLLYSAFTSHAGFKVNSGEYKLMGLAPYGEPKYIDLILDNLLDLKPDGTFRLNMDYFGYVTGFRMTNRKFDSLFGPAREPESRLRQRDMDHARSIQAVTEEIVLRLARTAHRELQADYLCLAGGVALNCVANGRVLREGPFRDIWIQPAAGDAGGAVGAALAGYHLYVGRPRNVSEADKMRGTYLGPSFDDGQIKARLDAVGAVYEHLSADESIVLVARMLSQSKVVGFFQGRMEFGPRALGNRSILGDPRDRGTQTTMNLKIKFRESFRPFAPAVLGERTQAYFKLDRPSPYMALVAQVADAIRLEKPQDELLTGIDKLKAYRSELPAITHVDYSARIQTVHRETNPRFHALLCAFESFTGCGVLVNTSFNVRGEPIVCTPDDAYRCFMRTDMDFLAIGNFLLDKARQPAVARDESWKTEFALD